MTKGEAIDICMEVRDYLTSGNPIWNKDKVGEALDMAIEALEETPRPSRPRPIDPTIKVDLESGVVPISACEPKEPKTIVYVDRRKGEWFGDKCSICGTERAWYGDTPDFCPDCGADMRGEDEC